MGAAIKERDEGGRGRKRRSEMLNVEVSDVVCESEGPHEESPHHLVVNFKRGEADVTKDERLSDRTPFSIDQRHVAA